MRNVLRIFQNDIRTLSKHFFALTIVIAITFLPALYAWFNVYAFWDPYGKTDQVKVAVVCNDQDYMDSDGKIINIGKDLVDELKDNTTFGYVFIDDADEAIEGKFVDGAAFLASYDGVAATIKDNEAALRGKRN